jgi:proteasome lid subunit RPN8/RPN11
LKAVYPSIEQWTVGEGFLQATLKGVYGAAQFGRESGAFWLGKREANARITALVFPRGPGVEEARGLWRVSPELFGAVTRWAVPRDLCLLAVAHTHTGCTKPFLSWTDRTFGVRIPGILAIVIGSGGKEHNYFRWGWYVFEENDYRQILRSEMRKRLRLDPSQRFEVWHADEGTVQILEDR